MSASQNAAQKYFEIRSSPIHGQGAFALRDIPQGTRIIEYLGERISHAEADARYDDDQLAHPHVLLFIVDEDTVVDGARGGNEARFINHCCDPNCETVVEDGQIFVEVIRDIARDEELTFDYHLQRPGRYRAEWKERYACRCGASNCRGTMLAPREPARRRKAK